MMKRIFTLLVAFSLLGSLATHAETGQTLVINGEAVTKTVTRITFDGDLVVLHFADNSTQEADMSSVVLTFSDVTSIYDLTAYSLRGLVDGRLNLAGLKAGTEIVVYNVSGKPMLRTTASSLNVSDLKAGVYVLKAGNQIVKFVKR